ncbi:MAG: amidohydrolase [Acidobacteria bacterium]|nr:amidohydrolase [Acidobacteriota bacterium]MBI3657787.1 amidohydrolase [Acidobacteriota bacterium]
MSTIQEYDLLITGGLVVTMNPGLDLIEEGYLLVRNGRIIEIGPRSQLRPAIAAKRVLDAGEKLVMPGLINAHTHAPMALFRGIADDRELMDWLANYIFPAEATAVTPDFVDWGTRLACWEMIRSGTTTFADMYFFEDTMADAAAQAGMRALLSQGIAEGPTPDSATAADGLARAEAFIAKWKGHPLIYPAVGPHSAYACKPSTLLRAKQIADQCAVPLLIHLAESQSENRLIQEQYHTTPVRHLGKLGLLDKNLVAAHCVWIDEEEIEMLYRHDVGIVHCPQSNMKLGSGIAPVPHFLKLGIKLGLGTDSPASNNRLNMVSEISAVAKLHKAAALDPTVVTAQQSIAMATMGAARALGMADEIGSLEVGKRADIVVVTLDEPNALPLYDIYSHMAYALESSNIETVIIDGRVVMENQVMMTLDTEAIRVQARQIKTKILGSLSVPHKGH